MDYYGVYLVILENMLGVEFCVIFYISEFFRIVKKIIIIVKR